MSQQPCHWLPVVYPAPSPTPTHPNPNSRLKQHWPFTHPPHHSSALRAGIYKAEFYSWGFYSGEFYSFSRGRFVSIGQYMSITQWPLFPFQCTFCIEQRLRLRKVELNRVLLFFIDSGPGSPPGGCGGVGGGVKAAINAWSDQRIVKLCYVIFINGLTDSEWIR